MCLEKVKVGGDAIAVHGFSAHLQTIVKNQLPCMHQCEILDCYTVPSPLIDSLEMEGAHLGELNADCPSQDLNLGPQNCSQVLSNHLSTRGNPKLEIYYLEGLLY